MNQTDYQTDSNRGSTNPQNVSLYSQYQWQQQQQHQPQQQHQQAKVVTQAAYDHDATNGSDIEETSRLLSNVFTNAAKGSPASMGSYSPQAYQQQSLSKHSSIPMTNTSGLSMFQDTSLWNPQEWMGDDQKRDRNGPMARYPTDASVDNKRMKYTDWGRSNMLSAPSQQSRGEDPSSMGSRASSYQISDDVIHMFNTPSVLGLRTDHDSPNRSGDNTATASHYSQVPNTPLQMQVDNHSYVDIPIAPTFDKPYEPMAGSLLQHSRVTQPLNGSNNTPSQTHNPNDGFANVYIPEDNSQDIQGLNMTDTSYMYPDHDQKDDHQSIQTYSPVSGKPVGILQQPDVFPYGNQYPNQNDLEEQQKKRRRESFGGNHGMPIERQSNLNEEGQLEASNTVPKRFRITIPNAIPNMNASSQFGGNPLYRNSMDAPESGMSPYGVQTTTPTAPVEQEFGSYPQSQAASPSSIKRVPNIKLIVKEPKVGKETKSSREPKVPDDLDDDDYSETHVAETTVRQTSSVKPVATEASINQCSFVTDNAMLDTISVRKCNYILNRIYSAGCCLPFVLPVPKVLALYHSVITNPSDLMTVENKLWNSGYSSTDEFHHDVAMIWRNAEKFHKNGGDIADKAQMLKQVYFDALQQLEDHRYANLTVVSGSIIARIQLTCCFFNIPVVLHYNGTWTHA
jgi:hypothetical protein